jgi:hypothetical protein
VLCTTKLCNQLSTRALINLHSWAPLCGSLLSHSHSMVSVHRFRESNYKWEMVIGFLMLIPQANRREDSKLLCANLNYCVSLQAQQERVMNRDGIFSRFFRSTFSSLFLPKFSLFFSRFSTEKVGLSRFLGIFKQTFEHGFFEFFIIVKYLYWLIW